MLPIATYIKTIQSNGAKSSEHTNRSALENLINGINQGEIFRLQNISIIQEASDKELEVEGTPDFFVYKDYNQLFRSLVGFIECKKVDYDLEKLISSDQIKKYSKTTQNIIITNYKEFVLLNSGKEKMRVKLLEENLTTAQNQNKEQEFINLLQEFYGYYQNQYIKTKKSLTSALAKQSFYYSIVLREFIDNENNEADSFHIKFKRLFKDYQTSLQYSYKLDDFCDIFSQSLVYGLLLVRLERQENLSENPSNYLREIPNYYRLLKEFLKNGYEEDYIPTKIKTALVQIGKNLNLINRNSINEEFKKNNDNKSNIAVYLYEDFLKSYDELKKEEKRKENGVYYTPKEVAEFIVKSVEIIIKEKFKKPEGFLTDEVKTLDFACGTGTFLEEVFSLITKKDGDSLQKQKIKNKILNDIYGFELLFTPYIVAHTILIKHLKDNEIEIDSEKNNERLGIYLTNTLDIDQHSISGHLPNLKKEHEKANNIKNYENILAIIGNPPYFNGKSQAKSPTIDGLIAQTYKKGLNEKKINLDDLYIKFIKAAEYKISEVNKESGGVVGIITNNSFLDGITHRKMRESLYNSFDEIYILNLHGNARKGEADKNIFDIMVGVSICFLIKYKKETPTGNLETNKKIFYFSTAANDLISRKEKLSFLKNNDLKTISWIKLKPEATKNFWFVNKDFGFEEEYQKFWGIAEIFDKISSGNKTERDAITIHYKKSDLQIILNDFQNYGEETIKEKYNLKDSRDWKIIYAKEDINNHFDQDLYTNFSYRPFDNRITFFTGKSRGFIGTPSKLGKSILGRENCILGISKSFSNKNFNNLLISKYLTDIHYNSDQSYFTPLYTYSQPQENQLDLSPNQKTKTPNFTKKFNQFIKDLDFKPSPEAIMAYIYAVLHCPIYRQKYLEFLKSDFPRIPFTKNQEVFEEYSILGQRLIYFHLLKISDDKEIKVGFGNDLKDFIIERITPPSNTSKTLILQTADKELITFENVDKEIYDFEIGSYKPIDKWLKYRLKDKVLLGFEDLEHIKKMIISIKNTILIMEEIKNLNQKYLNNLKYAIFKNTF